MGIMLGCSILVNVALAALIGLRECEHEEEMHQLHELNRCLRAELVDLIRRGRLLV
jgi:hypothetical protein